MGFAQGDSRQTNNLGIAKMYGFSECMGYTGYGLQESQLYSANFPDVAEPEAVHIQFCTVL
jgi:hypothetical protein